MTFLGVVDITCRMCRRTLVTGFHENWTSVAQFDMTPYKILQDLTSLSFYCAQGTTLVDAAICPSELAMAMHTIPD